MISTRSIAIDIAGRADDDMADAASWLVLERGARIDSSGRWWAFMLDGHTGTGPDPAAAMRDWAAEVLCAEASAGRGAA